jgi:hypothetical protein
MGRQSKNITRENAPKESNVVIHDGMLDATPFGSLLEM